MKKLSEQELFVRFKKYNKWHEIFAVDSLEVRCSFAITIVILILGYLFGLYSDYKAFEPALQNVTLYIASALIGMLGIILAGIGLMIGILNKDVVDEIERLNGKGSIDQVLVSFEFIAFLIGIQIFSFFSLYIILYSPRYLPPEVIFYAVVAIICYLFVFTVFYIVSLIANCIKVFFIVNTYSKIVHEKKNIYEEANEIRIEFLINNLLSDRGTNKEEFLRVLLAFIDESGVEDKEAVKRYLNQFYS